jgi:hypothetical protein
MHLNCDIGSYIFYQICQYEWVGKQDKFLLALKGFFLVPMPCVGTLLSRRSAPLYPGRRISEPEDVLIGIMIKYIAY